MRSMSVGFWFYLKAAMLFSFEGRLGGGVLFCAILPVFVFMNVFPFQEEASAKDADCNAGFDAGRAFLQKVAEGLRFQKVFVAGVWL